LSGALTCCSRWENPCPRTGSALAHPTYSSSALPGGNHERRRRHLLAGPESSKRRQSINADAVGHHLGSRAAKALPGQTHGVARRPWRYGPQRDRRGLLSPRTISCVKGSRSGLLATLVVAGVAACAAQPSRSPAVPQVTYSCCETKDVDTLYQPGQTLTIHWIVNRSDESGATPLPVELGARLTGPFATVEALKAATSDSQTAPELVTLTAAVVRPSGRPGERPVSTIAIGSAAKPGYYNLRTAITGISDRDEVGGASIIKVIPVLVSGSKTPMKSQLFNRFLSSLVRSRTTS
jgi:hypothetical protein